MTVNLYERLSETRKRLQVEGLIPPWYSTAAYQLFSQKYEYETHGRSVRGQFERIAKTAAKHLIGTKWENIAEQKFFELMWNGWLSPSTPVLANMGTNRGLPVSCSGGVVQDSINGFYTSRHETAMLTKNGFGTSSYLGGIRPRGSSISVGGKASGVVPVFKGFVQDMRDVAQGTARRGAWAGYIEIDHGDFDELVDHLMAEPDDANVGWIISNGFIAKLNSGDSEALRRYQRAMKCKMVTGKGYFFFVDKVNAKRPAAYVNNNLTVKASNLCLTGDTLIDIVDVEENGIVETIRLDAFVEKWNAGVYNNIAVKTSNSEIDGFAKVTAAAKTGDVNELIEIDTNSGKIVKCTPNHLIFTKTRGWVEAQHLKETDELFVYSKNGSQSEKKEVIKIKRIKLETSVPVYDISVPVTESFFANDILVHNCSEITLFSDADHTFTCVLSSMVLSRWDEFAETDAIYWSTIFLDCVASEFIEKAKYITGLERAVRFTEKGRALGLGQMGFHTLLQQKMIAFESFDAHMLSQLIAARIWEESERASKDMAIELGEPLWCKGTGLRNTHRIAIAPTKSTSGVSGGVSEGINPDPAMTYTQLTAAGEVDRINPVLLQLMKKKGVYTKKNIADISDKKGSVQHVDWLTQEEKQVFKTAFEIDQRAILRLASARGRYIDQWQSLNLFFAAEEDPVWISEIHQQAFNDPNILALYYVYSMSGVQGSKDECVACSG